MIEQSRRMRPSACVYKAVLWERRIGVVGPPGKVPVRISTDMLLYVFTGRVAGRIALKVSIVSTH